MKWRSVEFIDDDGGNTEAHAGHHRRKASYQGTHGHHTPTIGTLSILDPPGIAIGIFAIRNTIIGGVAFPRQKGVRGCCGIVRVGFIHGDSTEDNLQGENTQ